MLGSVGPGDYRVVIHANGNCTSPNGFSAGPPWAPPGVAAQHVVLVRKNDDYATRSWSALRRLRLDGPDGVLGRSVVVHAGAHGSLAARPAFPTTGSRAASSGAAVERRCSGLDF